MYKKECVKCGKEFETRYKAQKQCNECKQAELDARVETGPNSYVRNLTSWEQHFKSKWTKRATAKNDRIKGEGYAERQKQRTLELVGKVKVEL